MDHRGKDSLNTWRTVALLGLTLNHLLLWPLENISFAMKITYQSLGWVSFASVFFAAAGIQWGRKACTTDSLWVWNIRRSGKLLLWVFSATILFVFAVESQVIKPVPWQRHISWIEPLTPLKALAGLKLPWLLDVIWLHAWLGIYATIVWSVFGKNKSPLAIAAVSVLVWIAGQTDAVQLQILPTSAEAPPWHHWTGWQLIFVIGALSQRDEVKRRLELLKNPFFTKLLFSAALLLFMLKQSTASAHIDDVSETKCFGPWFTINTLVLCLLARKYQLPKLPAGLAAVGRRTLVFYSLQILAVYLLGSHSAFSQNQKFHSFVVIAFLLASFFALAHLLMNRRSA